MTRITLREADAVVAVSEHLRRVVVSRYGVPLERTHTIINGYNTSIFGLQPQSRCRQALGLPENSRLIVYVGRLIEAKGLRELLQAFTLLAAKDESVHLSMIGDGVMRSEIARLAKASPAAARIYMPGALTPAQVANWLGACDVATLPSWSEGYPNVVVEALACGRPVVASRVGGVPEIVHEDNGILVPPRDTDALARGLETALAREWNREAIAGMMHRTWDDVASETLRVYQSLRVNLSQ